MYVAEIKSPVARLKEYFQIAQVRLLKIWSSEKHLKYILNVYMTSDKTRL